MPQLTRSINQQIQNSSAKNKNMKQVLILSLLVITFVSARAQTQPLVNFQFTLNPTAWEGGPVSGWINVQGDPSQSVITVTDPTSHITISSVATTNWYSDDGTAAQDRVGDSIGSTYFPALIMIDNWYQYSTSTQAQYNAMTPQLKLSGLNKDSSYILRMTASTVYDPTISTSQYTVAGRSVYSSQTLNCYNNTTQGVTFQHVYPDSNGIIRIYVNSTATSQVGMISGLQVIPGSANVGAPTVAFTKPANGTILPEGSNLTVTATASETGGTIAKVEFYDDTTKIATLTTSPYTFTWNDPDPGSHTLTAKATDNVGTIGSASIVVGVDPLNYFWSTTGNSATGGDSNFIGTVDSNKLVIRTKNTNRMTISAIGNVGIGVDSPTAQLHTKGKVRFAGITGDSTQNRVLVSDTSGNIYYRNVSSLNNRWVYSGGTLYDSSDNIAIGTNNPVGYKLAVNGTAIFTKAKVKMAGTWPDYVFKKDYALPNLREVENYISQHQHLPGIISENEVQLYGIDLGDHAAALLKKVEELTLYLIQQDKALTAKGDQLVDLEKRLVEQKVELDAQKKQSAEQQARLDSQQKQIDELRALINAKK
jgi:hypothetical protein